MQIPDKLDTHKDIRYKQDINTDVTLRHRQVEEDTEIRCRPHTNRDIINGHQTNIKQTDGQIRHVKDTSDKTLHTDLRHRHPTKLELFEPGLNCSNRVRTVQTGFELFEPGSNYSNRVRTL